MGGAASPLPYQQITTTSELPQWKKELYGFTKNAPEYSPFKALSRQAGTQAKMIEGMTSRPSWSAMYEAMGVPQGQDLTPYIQAMRTGTQGPQAPIPTSPAAGTIPEFTAPSEEVPKKEAAQGGLMSLRKGYAKGGLTADQANFLTNKLASGKNISKQWQKKLDAYNKEQTTKADTPSTPAVPLSQAMNVVTPFYDPAQAQGQYGGVTNPIYQQAMDKLREVSKTPEQFGQATGIMQGAADRLMGMANYTPEQVEAAKIARSDIRDVAAQQADVERYKAANIVPTARETGVTTAAPGSWTQAGTAAQYMSPYMQNVVDIQKREAQRDFGKQMAALNAQAAGAGAYGGSRQAIERSEARRNQAQRLADIEAQGLQQAYSQGMGQFQAEQGLGAQVGMSNTAQINQLKSQYMQMGLTEAQANQAAQNAAAQFGAASQNQAYNNYVQQMLTAQGMNQGMDYNTAMQNAQLKQQAAIQNQQAGLTAQGLNLQALNQAGQMGQGIGALGTSMWGQQQNIPQLWGAAGQTVQNIAQQAATGAQQTAQNWWGGMNNAYAPVTNMLSQTPGTTAQQNVAQTPR